MVHTRPCLALNLFVRELSKRHDSCECTIRSLLERTPPCNVSELAGQQYFSYFCLFVLQNWSTFNCLLDMQAWMYAFVLYFRIFFFFFIWPWKFVALNVTVYDITDSSLTQWEPSLIFQTQRFMPIRTASICVYACVYRYIYKEREIFMNLFFLFCDESYYYETNKKNFFLVEHCHVILKGSV